MAERSWSGLVAVIDSLYLMSGSQWFHWIGGWVIGLACGVWLIGLHPNLTAGSKRKKAYEIEMAGWRNISLAKALIEIFDKTKAVDIVNPDIFSTTSDQRMEFHWNLLKNLAVSGLVQLNGVRSPSWKMLPIPVHAIERCSLVGYSYFVLNGEAHYSAVNISRSELDKAIEIILSELRIATREHFTPL